MIRSTKGSTIAEFGLAFSVLALMTFFPAVGLLGMYSTYSAAVTLNEVQVQQASLLNFQVAQSPDGPIRKGIPDFFRTQSGLGSYAKLRGPIETELEYSAASIDKYGMVNRWVDVTTTVTLEPFVSIAYLPLEVPGMNRPFSITLRSRRLMEDLTNAPPLSRG